MVSLLGFLYQSLHSFVKGITWYMRVVLEMTYHNENIRVLVCGCVSNQLILTWCMFWNSYTSHYVTVSKVLDGISSGFPVLVIT